MLQTRSYIKSRSFDRNFGRKTYKPKFECGKQNMCFKTDGFGYFNTYMFPDSRVQKKHIKMYKMLLKTFLFILIHI